MPAACAIDFGTSNTTVALVKDGKVSQLPVDPTHRDPALMPTLMYFHAGNAPIYGSAAIRAYLENEREGRLIQAIKRYLPSNTFEGTSIGAEVLSLERLIGGFLKHIRAVAEKAAGEPVTRVLMGRPALFSPLADRDALAENRLRSAAQLAGFREIAFQVEPVAAARAFEQTLDHDVLCLVGDLGGGTSDFTVIRLGPGRAGSASRAEDVLGVAGIDIAGNDFDARLVWGKVTPHLGVRSKILLETRWVDVPNTLHHAVTRWHTLCHAATPKNLRQLDTYIRTGDDKPGLRRLRELIADDHGYNLFRAIEATKIALSERTDTTLSFAGGSIALDESVSRGEFERYIGDDLTRLRRVMDELLAKVGIAPSDIDVVFLTGGTSKTLAVQRLFAETFGERVVSRDVFTSIGFGLGIEASERFAT
jgi:hypothetical chaperone protein